MPKLEIVSSGPIYRNPNPGYQYVFAAFSHPLQVTDQEFVCTYNRGQAMYATDLTFFLARSQDGGHTWPEQQQITDRSRDLKPYSYHGPFLTRLRDGTLLIAAFRVDRTDPERPLFNEATGGLIDLELILLRSADNGRSWSAPQLIAPPPGMLITPSSAILELGDGRWLLPCDRWHPFADPGPYRPQTIALFSADQGRSWGDPVLFADGAAQHKGFWHGKLVPLQDGRLFTLFWSAQMPSVADLPLHRCVGTPDGRSWSEPEPTNLPGQTNNVVDLGGGRMAAIYTVREHEAPGFYAALSTDQGKNWDLENQLQIWDATGRDRLGVSALKEYPRSHDTIAFGAPTALLTRDGQILASYWCTEMSVTQVRYSRLRVVD